MRTHTVAANAPTARSAASRCLAAANRPPAHTADASLAALRHKARHKGHEARLAQARITKASLALDAGKWRIPMLLGHGDGAGGPSRAVFPRREAEWRYMRA
jgi:hypothetical protein